MDLAIRTKEKSIVGEAIARLSEDDRKIIIQRHDQSLTLSDILKPAQQLQEKTKGFTWRFRGKDMSLKEQTANICKLLKKLEPIGDNLANLDPIHAGLPWAGVKAIIEVGLASDKQRTLILQGIDYVLSYTKRIQLYIEMLDSTAAGANLRERLVETYACILEFLAIAIRTLQANAFKRTAQAVLWPKDVLTNFAADIEKCRDGLREDASIKDSDHWQQLEKRLEELDKLHDIQTVIEDISDRLDMAGLEYVKSAMFDSYEEDKPGCLEGTRVQLLESIRQWAYGDGEMIYWLCGKAGTGKSTISRTVAKSLAEDEVVATFFFKRNEAGRDNARLLVPTLVKQLTKALPLKNLVADALRKEPSICSSAINKQFTTLLKSPLQQCRVVADLYIILDALDECRVEDVETLIPLLAELRDINGIDIKILVSSRPEVEIIEAFEDVQHIDIKLEEVQEYTVEDDIKTLVRHEFKKMSKVKRFPKDWPSAEELDKLAKISTPLFIAAATFLKYVATKGKKTYQQRLQDILQQDFKLDSFYEPVLREIEDMQLFKIVVGAVVVMYDPIHVGGLSRLLDVEVEQILDLVESLQSVLSISAGEHQTVRPFHLSFRDYLLDSEHLSEIDTHTMLFKKCLNVMQGLQEVQWYWDDYWGYSVPKVDPTTAYACQFWSLHAQGGKLTLDDEHDLCAFLNVHFLHWAQVVCLWAGRSDKTTESMARALDKLAPCIVNEELVQMLYDGSSFLRQHGDLLKGGDEQVYYLPLHFLPSTNWVRRTFADVLQRKLSKDLSFWVLREPSMSVKWSVPGEEGYITTDCKTVLTWESEGIINHWDFATGRIKHSVVVAREPHPYESATIIFTDRVLRWLGERDYREWDITDGQLLVSYDFEASPLGLGSNGNAVLIDDDGNMRLVNQNRVMDILKVPGELILKVRFSASGSALATVIGIGSGRSQLDIWKDWEHLNSMSIVCPSTIVTAGFAVSDSMVTYTNGDTLVLATHEGHIIQTFNLNPELEYHTAFIDDVTLGIYSKSGRVLLSDLTSLTMRGLQDVSRHPYLDEYFHHLQAHVVRRHKDYAIHESRFITSIAGVSRRDLDMVTISNVKHYGKVVATVCTRSRILVEDREDAVVRTWSLETGEHLCTFKLSSSLVQAVSPDGTSVVWYDGALKLTRGIVSNEDSHILLGIVRPDLISYSMDSSRIVMLVEGRIEVHDTVTQHKSEVILTLEDRTSVPYDVHFDDDCTTPGSCICISGIHLEKSPMPQEPPQMSTASAVVDEDEPVRRESGIPQGSSQTSSVSDLIVRDDLELREDNITLEESRTPPPDFVDGDDLEYQEDDIPSQETWTSPALDANGEEYSKYAHRHSSPQKPWGIPILRIGDGENDLLFRDGWLLCDNRRIMKLAGFYSSHARASGRTLVCPNDSGDLSILTMKTSHNTW